MPTDWIPVDVYDKSDPFSGPFVAEVMLDFLDDGTAILVGLKIERDPKDRGDVSPWNDITKGVLSGFDRQEAIRQAAEKVTKVSADEDRDFEKLSTREERIIAAAQLYRLAVMRGSHPREFIATSLDCSLMSVDRYLREARKQGLLPAYHRENAVHGEKKKKASGTSRKGKKGTTK